MYTNTPLIFIRKMLGFLKVNQPSQSFIEEAVPSLSNILSYSKEDIVDACTNALETLFSKYDLDLSYDVYITTVEEDGRTYFLNIQIEYEDSIYKEELQIDANNTLVVRNIHKEELLEDKVY